jgi:hypothetical protein
MNTIKKSLNGVQTVDASDDAQVNKSAVTQFIQSSLRNSNRAGIEETTLDFEDKSDITNSKYIVYSDNGNPLDYGLKQLNSMSKVVSGKSALGISSFNELPNITVSKIEKSTADELIPFILETLEMTTPVIEGMRKGLNNAIEFNNLSKSIAQELKRGGEIYQTFISEVKSKGREAVKEWVNSGTR